MLDVVLIVAVVAVIAVVGFYQLVMWDATRERADETSAQRAQREAFASYVRQPMPARLNARTSHSFHFTMTVLSVGLWLPAWAIAACRTRTHRRRTQRAHTDTDDAT
jgi:4-amino-4-deoxy-L-arabinose transferase-like glycosyltransferase